jgi:hypothetical protein
LQIPDFSSAQYAPSLARDIYTKPSICKYILYHLFAASKDSDELAAARRGHTPSDQT